MLFGVLSINYQQTPIEIRDQVALSDTRKMELFTNLRLQGVQQSVILSTCNRCEVYVMVDEIKQIEQAQTIFMDMFIPLDIASYLVVKTNHDAIQYIFEVTSGLHSLVLGEDQILGQVIEAVRFSKEMGCNKKQIDKIFKAAITTAKKIKTQLKISEHPMSLSYLGIQQLRRVCGISNQKVLILGSGSMAELAMKYVYEDGPKQVWNCNRSMQNAAKLKEKFPLLEICDFTHRYEVLAKCDIVIAATSSPHIVLHYHKDMTYANHIYVLDLASPRDVDPAFPHVYNIDSLEELAKQHKQKRIQKMEAAKQIIERDVQELLHWLATSRMDQTLKTLQDHIDEVVQDTYAILNRKLDMNERERYILKKTLYASMQRLMKDPIQKIKHVDIQKQEPYQNMMEDIFIKQKKENPYEV